MVIAKGTCEGCGGETHLNDMNGIFEVKCIKCSNIYYLGNSLDDAVDVLMDITNKATTKNTTTVPALLKKGKCSKCGRDELRLDYLQNSTGDPYTVYCSSCLHIFYSGNSSKQAHAEFLNVQAKAALSLWSVQKTSTGRISAPSPPNMVSNWKLTNTPVNILKRKCPMCGDGIKVVPHATGWLLACRNNFCTTQYTGTYDEVVEFYDKLTCGKITGKSSVEVAEENTVKTTVEEAMTTKAAYEANKQRDTCIVCGKPLGFHAAVSVRYCPCVEKLPK